MTDAVQTAPGQPAGATWSPLLDVRDLKTYFFSREGTSRAVDGVSFRLERGKVLGIAGESGCGKSVTSQSILRIVPKNGQIVGGQILLHQDDGVVDLASLNAKGAAIRRIRGKEISMVFQEPMTSFSPVYSVGNQIMETLRLHQNLDKHEARMEAISLLEKVGMPNAQTMVNAYPFELSGGMRQRAMIAMALSCRPSLLIADEPTSALDVTVQAQILDLLRELMQEFNMAVVLITHDLGIVAELADDLLIMYLGKAVEFGDVRTIFHNCKHPYTQGLLASVPKLGKPEEELVPIAGSVPSLYELPSGCTFHPRCPHFMAGLCDTQEPPEVEVEPGHRVKCFLYKDERPDEQ